MNNFFIKMADFEKRQQLHIIFRADVIRIVQLILRLWCSIILENVYSGVSEGDDSESCIRFANLDPI